VRLYLIDVVELAEINKECRICPNTVGHVSDSETQGHHIAIGKSGALFNINKITTSKIMDKSPMAKIWGKQRHMRLAFFVVCSRGQLTSGIQRRRTCSFFFSKKS
jgi:hypothetical protein